VGLFLHFITFKHNPVIFFKLLLTVSLLLSAVTSFSQYSPNKYTVAAGVAVPVNTFGTTNKTGVAMEFNYERLTNSAWSFVAGVGLDIFRGGDDYKVTEGPVTSYYYGNVANIGWLQTGVRFYPLKSLYLGASMGYAGIAGCANDTLHFRDCDNSSGGWLHSVGIGYKYKRFGFASEYKNISRKKGDDFEFLDFRISYLLRRD
jgi:hypothetical protein